MSEIIYLSTEDAYTHFKTAPHIPMMQNFEVYLRTGKTVNNVTRQQTIMAYYKNAIRQFGTSDKQTISRYVDYVRPLIEKHAPGLLPQKLCFLKLKKGTEWNFPFTLNNCIVLTSQAIKRAKSLLTTNPKEFMVILVHEMIHLHQKAHPTQYNLLYKRNYSMQQHPVKLSQSILQWVITNPDGFRPEWIIQYKSDRWFLPLLITDEHGEMREVLVSLKRELNGDYIDDGSEPVPISAYAPYSALYGIDKQLYHPHEITARLLSEYIIQDHVYITRLITPRYYKELLGLY